MKKLMGVIIILSMMVIFWFSAGEGEAVKATTTPSGSIRWDDCTAQKAIRKEFKAFLLQSSGNEDVIPEGTKLKSAFVVDGDLVLDFSKELLNYGGSSWERELVDLLLTQGFEIPYIRSVTIRIEGKEENFVEGTSINGYTRENWINRSLNNEN